MERDQSRLIGAWRLLAVQVELADDGSRHELLGANPVGRLILTGDGHMSAILTASDRRPPTDVPGTAALFGSMMAFSGTFRLEDSSKIVFCCDMAWHPAWAGTEQVRFYTLADDRLTLRTSRQTHPSHPGREVYGIIEWAREA